VSWYAVVVFLHLVAAVLLVGYALFWVVMAWSDSGEREDKETRGYLRIAGEAAWPSSRLPRPFRALVFGVGWLFLGAMIVTGLLLLELRGISIRSGPGGAWLESRFGVILVVKLGLVGALAAGQWAFSRSARPWLAYLNGMTALGIVIASALLRH
jgi:hypothetical protein